MYQFGVSGQSWYALSAGTVWTTPGIADKMCPAFRPGTGGLHSAEY
jgi:hypothetical protein